MGELKGLFTEGVSDLHSYNIGVRDGRRELYKEIIDMITRSLSNPALEYHKMTPQLALSVLIGALHWTADEEEKKNDETN
jgi:hypothetical protein